MKSATNAAAAADHAFLRSLAKAAFPEWKGRKISSRTTGEVTFWDTNWSGGTRNVYRALQVATGQTRSLHVPAPWVNPIEGKTAPIPPGIVVVEKSQFCGGPASITIHFPAPLPSADRPALPA